ncbi:hypothetical protein VTO73DRAFT_3889 [Trametes versicolor]
MAYPGGAARSTKLVARDQPQSRTHTHSFFSHPRLVPLSTQKLSVRTSRLLSQSLSRISLHLSRIPRVSSREPIGMNEKDA